MSGEVDIFLYSVLHWAWPIEQCIQLKGVLPGLLSQHWPCCLPSAVFRDRLASPPAPQTRLKVEIRWCINSPRLEESMVRTSQWSQLTFFVNLLNLKIAARGSFRLKFFTFTSFHFPHRTMDKVLTKNIKMAFLLLYDLLADQFQPGEWWYQSFAYWRKRLDCWKAQPENFTCC